MTYAGGHQPSYDYPWATMPAPLTGAALVQSISSGNANTSSHGLTLGGSPTANTPLFCMFGVESTTITVSSITQTGATWSLLVRHVNAGTGLELWATPQATGTGVTVTMSGANWSGVTVAEISGVKPGLAESTNSSTYGARVPARYGACTLAQARRAGGGGGNFTWSVEPASTITTFVNGNNFSTIFVTPSPRSMYIDGSSGNQLMASYALPLTG